MRDLIIEIFGDYSRLIIFLHVASGSLLVGTMFMMRFIMWPARDDITDLKLKYSMRMDIMRRYMAFLVPVMLLIAGTSVFMHLGLGFKTGNPISNIVVHIKEALWTFISFNFIYMLLKYLRAKKGFGEGNFIEVEENVILMIRYLIPLNLLLSIISIYFGVILRGF